MGNTGRNKYGNTSGNEQHEENKRRARQQAYEEYIDLRKRTGTRGNYVKSGQLSGTGIPEGFSGGRRRSSGGKSRQDGRKEDLAARINKRRAIAENNSNNRADDESINAPAERQGGRSAGSGKRNKGNGNKRSVRRIILIVALILVIGAGALVAAALTFVGATLNKMGTIDVDLDDIGINPQVDEELSDYRNIAILGIDSRDMDSDEDTRSDAIIVLSINKETDEVKMFSVYRDTMLYLGDDVGLDKVTHAYYYGKATRVLYALNKNMDLNIKEVMVVNWKSVADLVNDMGGIDVDIQESEINEMNKYIKDTAKTIGGSKAKIKSAGEQTLNGNQAVTYARIRKDAVEGDRRRNERMKIVVQAVFDKAKTMKLSELNNLANEILPEVKTNLSTRSMMGLLLNITSYSMTDSDGWPYEVADWTGDAYYGPPVTLKSNVSELHEKFFDQKDYTPTEDVQNISEQISEKTGYY